ncbi:ABC transporter transmembrane region 2-domain-containing protein, partial [Kickxella alabastrina]|uniref:ABC transporter transmembrane region 2-domain-containing protein n=1 Tax=Kickxella alabastrina TaxID=61397 RepID=UPI0022207A97
MAPEEAAAPAVSSSYRNNGERPADPVADIDISLGDNKGDDGIKTDKTYAQVVSEPTCKDGAQQPESSTATAPSADTDTKTAGSEANNEAGSANFEIKVDAEGGLDSHTVSAKEDDTSHAVENSQYEDDYTSDSYTEDNEYSDEYAEESIFSDSNYSGNSDADNDRGDSQPDEISDQGSGHHNPTVQPQPQHRQPWILSDNEPVSGAGQGVFDTRFSSRATSPTPADALNTTRATNALAPSHRFVSHTPWGTSTGRLTRGQRDKAGCGMIPPAEEGLSGPEFVQDEFPITRSAVQPNGDSEQLLQQQRQHMPMPLQQEQAWQSSINANATANRVVNVVSVHQGTKGYSQLEEQIQREHVLQQDTIKGKLLQGQNAPRIVTIAQFIKSVSRLLGIGFPSASCTEARLTLALVAVLGVRTVLDVWFANFNARCVRAVVTYDRKTLLRRLLPEYLAMTLPMAAINQAIKWVISSLTIALRVRLGRYAHQRYVDGITNITWNQLHHQGPNGSTPAYERPDWLLTVQIHRFADMFPRLIADVVKPTMDWFVFSRLLSKGSLTMVLYVVLANIIIRVSSPPTGKNASRLAQLEEKYRGVYARISSIIQRAAAANQRYSPSDPSPHTTTPHAPDMRSNNARNGRQQPAFVPRVQAAFRKRAQDALDGSLDSVTSSVVSTNIRRFFGGIGESMLAKYGATLTAYYLLSRPLCSPGRRLASEIMHDPRLYSRNSAYLINLSQATTRLLLMVNDLPKFVWSTVKVDRLLRSLD